MIPWIHPHLSQSVHPLKGRQLQAAERIQKGEVLLIDPPYAIIPTPTPTTDVDASNSTILLCSNPQCNAHVPQKAGTPCPNRCIADVTWCGETCRETDQPRHAFECTWLSKYANPIRAKWGEYTFGMLWLIVRLLARRYTDTDTDTTSGPQGQGSDDTTTDSKQRQPQSSSSSPRKSNFASAWPAINSLCGTPETWSHSSVREWTILVKKYLSRSSLPHDLPNDEVLALICKEEANSFGLYPRATGTPPSLPPTSDPLPEPDTGNETRTGRGEQFGAAVFPTASIANHDCWPNITHKPNKTGCMVFTASRAIAAGEECCIAYFDMAEFASLSARREHLSRSFRFRCGCGRCVAEERETESETKGGDGDGGQDGGWDAFPGFE